MGVQRMGGHVSDVTLYTPSRTVLRAALYFFNIFSQVGDLTPMRFALCSWHSTVKSET